MVALPNTRLHQAPHRVAVVLNTNARKVDAETVTMMKSFVADKDLFLSHSQEEGAQIAARIVAADYDVVLWGGGDGTFAAGVSSLAKAAKAMGTKVPAVGVLPFGTGNALAWAVGANSATPNAIADSLQRARTANKRRPLQMLNVEGSPTMFCGFGLDAQIIDDHGKTVDALGKVGLADTIQSAGLRYFLSVTGRSLPLFIAKQRAEVIAVNRGRPAKRLDVNGNQVGATIPEGGILWRGPATLAGAASIPFYGLGLKMFPHAESESGRFQVRLSDASPVEVLSKLPTIWRGDYCSDTINDFLVDTVEFIVAKPAPFQSGGDIIGDRSRVTVSLWNKPIEVV